MGEGLYRMVHSGLDRGGGTSMGGKERLGKQSGQEGGFFLSPIF